MCALLRASRRALAVRVFPEKFSAHFGEFPQSFRKFSATFAGAVETILGQFSAKISAKFPQLLEVQFAVRGGGGVIVCS